MIDTLLRFRDAARERRAADRFGVAGRDYVVLTLHRPNNVDELDQFARVLDAVIVVGRCAPVIFPVHPRTRSRLRGTELERRLASEPGIVLTDPLGYLDFISLVDGSTLVLTDSGGIQEETTVLGVPCLTLRESTERPVTVSAGTNTVVGTDPDLIVESALAVLEGEKPDPRLPELWDGRAGERIVTALVQRLPVTTLPSSSGY
jgi:UDP-N-acetylglucosamine 2-epimerase (non-hydrolysing)